MAIFDKATRDGSLMIDRSAHSIALERVLAASPPAVFDAWTRPEQVICWWDPAGRPLLSCAIDLRPGGQFAFVTYGRPDMPFAGAYVEIEPPQRLVFDVFGAIGRVLIEDQAGRTRLRVEIQCRSAEHLDQFLQAGVHHGTARTLDNLTTFVSGQTG